jgi:multidrug efflux pump subunit AcrB
VIQGARQVAVPATFGVLTTIAAFAPMLFVGGIVGPFFEAMSVVVILCLFFSLVESKLILPAHLTRANIKPVNEEEIFAPYHTVKVWRRVPKFFQRVQRRFQHGFQSLIHDYYAPLLDRAIQNRGLSATIFVAVLILAIGLMQSGIVRTVLFPEVPGDFIRVGLTMQNGTAPEARNEVLDRVEKAILQINEEYVAEHPGVEDPVNHVGTFTNGDTGGVIFVEMPMNEDRPLNGDDLTAMWRERVGEMPGVKELDFSDGDGFGGGAPLSFALSGDNSEALEDAADALERKLQEYEGVFDIRNSLTTGGEEIRLKIKPEAEALGLTMSSLGRQVRQAFYGEEAQRIQRGKDELKVMVRYPREHRRSIEALENMRIRTPDGEEVPFGSMAEVEFGEAYSSITRLNRKRTITVSADIDPERVEPQAIIRELSEEFIPELLSRHPGVGYGLEGASLEEREFKRNISIASVAALFLIFALIAIPLHSYVQPLIIMSVIPFGMVGALIGHIIMQEAISMFSLFGLIALAGVVVNDSLIMIDFINTARREGATPRDAVLQSGVLRFRAIVLTSLTTAAGLMPIMLERSVQAQFVIPMAISLSFGILFATVITLFLVPCLYLLELDFRGWLRRMAYLALGKEEEYRRALAETRNA